MPENMEIPAARKHGSVIFYRKPVPLAADAVKSDWPQFLGPAQSSTSPETGLLKQLEQPKPGEPDPLLAWALVKGESYSAPSIKGGRVVFTHRMQNMELVECLAAETGALYWVNQYPTTYKDQFNYLNGPRSSPAIEGNRVYTLGVQGVLSCLDLRNGHLYWRRDLKAEFGVAEDFFGFSTSPLLEGDRLIINLGMGKCVAAFDKTTGKLDWVSGDQWGRSYATPVAATVHGQRVVFVFAGGMTSPPVGGLLGLDPESGKIHCRFPWRSPRVFSANASSPVVSGNRVFISTSYDIFGAMLEIQPDLSCRLAYQTKAYASHWTTPILHDGYLYGFANNKLTCMEWTTGERKWRQTLRYGEEQNPSMGSGRGADQYREPPGSSGFGIGSLIRAGGHFLALGETGLLAWLDLSPEGCRVISTRRLFNARQTWTAPVLSSGLLYITQNNADGTVPPRLLCYDLRTGKTRVENRKTTPEVKNNSTR